MSKTKQLFPLVTVDVALFTIDGGELKVLLSKRSDEPFKGWWSLPGGVLDTAVDDNLLAAANRIMLTKLGLTLPHMEEVFSASGASRDPRGWSISMTYLALLPMDKVHAIAGKKVDNVEWATIRDIGRELAFDHTLLLHGALEKLQLKVMSSVLPLHMLSQKFTLTQLQRTIETITGESLEKSAFRRRLKDLHANDIEEVAGEFERGVQRPAQLWRASKDYRFH